MTGAGAIDETMTAALIQIAGHADRIADLDGRYQELAEALSGVTDQAAAAAERADAGAGQADVLASLDALDKQVGSLSARLTAVARREEGDFEDAKRYQPVPSPRWWAITGQE